MVDLSASRVLCSFHPMPWKSTWNEPTSVVAVTKFTIELFNILVADDKFVALCNSHAELINIKMPLPLCCWCAVHYPHKFEQAYKSVGVDPPSAEAIARLN